MEVKLFGVRLRCEFSFLAVTAIIFLIGDSSGIIGIFSVCLIHELAHAVVLCIVGGKLDSMIFSGFGIKMIPKRRLIPKNHEILILISGPLMNLILFGFFGFCDFGIMNLSAGIFNLFPHRSLDGGRILELIEEK